MISTDLCCCKCRPGSDIKTYHSSPQQSFAVTLQSHFECSYSVISTIPQCSLSPAVCGAVLISNECTLRVKEWKGSRLQLANTPIWGLPVSHCINLLGGGVVGVGGYVFLVWALADFPLTGVHVRWWKHCGEGGARRLEDHRVRMWWRKPNKGEVNWWSEKWEI